MSTASVDVTCHGRVRHRERAERRSQSVPERVNPFAHSLRASLDALAASDLSAAREAQGGNGHGVSGVQAVEHDHTALP